MDKSYVQVSLLRPLFQKLLVVLQEDYGLHGVLGHLVAIFVVHVVCKKGQDRVDLLRMDAHVQS
jgi:hypothetical protein